MQATTTTTAASLLAFGLMACANAASTTTEEEDAASCATAGAQDAIDAPAADRAAALPYRYARVRRGGAVMYDTLPGRLAQLVTEPKLRPPRHPARKLGAGAVDVPRDQDGLPSGPAVIQPGAVGVAADGYRWRRTFFGAGALRSSELRATLPPGQTPLAQQLARLLPTSTTLRRRSVVAFRSSVQVDLTRFSRQFAVLVNGKLVATDQLEPLLGSSWHGVDVRTIGLPLAFALRHGVRPRRIENGASRRLDDDYQAKAPIPLTGRFRTVQGTRHYHTREGSWVRARDVIMVFPRQRFPDFAKGDTKWLDVSLANQYLVAYRGTKPIYVTLISSGRSRLGDPETEPATPRGLFRVTAKHLTHDIDGREVKRRYQLYDIPWVVETSGALSLCAGMWLWRFGEARGHHNIALPPVDARWLFDWTTPKLPAADESVAARADEGTLVYVHK